jgi:CheY-like chemotaxis protein
MRGITERDATILLVEDDLGDQELVKRAFQSSKIRNRLTIVNNGEEALDYLLHRNAFSTADSAPRPDLILLDLNMPKVNGRQVLEQVKADSKLRSIPIVVLTTSQHEEDIFRAYDLGVNSYVTKPVTMQNLVELIGKLEEYWFRIVVLPEARD